MNTKVLSYPAYCGAFFTLLEDVIREVEDLGLNPEDNRRLFKLIKNSSERIEEFKDLTGWK